MRELNEVERAALKTLKTAWVIHLEDDPEMASFISFNAGFIAGLDHAAGEIANLRAENDRLRAALERIEKGNPATPGNWLSDIEMADIARQALEGER